MGVEILSVLTPITEGHEQPLREQLRGFQDHSPLADVPGTHAGRWVVLHWLGTGDRTRRRRLRPAQLLFSAVVDGPVDAWLWGLLKKQANAVNNVWRHCPEWPATGHSTDRARWLLEHKLDVTFPFIAHDKTVFEIEQGLKLRKALADLAAEAPAMSDDTELRAAYASLPPR